MSTEIQWTDETWNPVTGCTKVSDGCVLKTRSRVFTDVQTHEDRLDQPLRWRKPARIFVNSMSDLFHEDVSDEFIDQVFAVMALSPQHTFQLLTKRSERMLAYMGRLSEIPAERLAAAAFRMDLSEDADCLLENVIRGYSWWRDRPERGVPLDGSHPLWPLPNVWLGVSVENQHFADERIPLLLQTPAAVRFISAEPLLGPVDMFAFMRGELRDQCVAILNHSDPRWPKIEPGLDWVIVGGESGPNARPLWVPWVRSIVRQCHEADVPVFVKQLGADVRDRNDAGFTGDGDPRSWPDMDPDDIEEDLDGTRDGYQGAPVRVHLRNKKGGDMSEWPEDLRVREFPKAASHA